MDVSSSSLCPGYLHVDAFGPDECYEDEEVCYVTLDLGSIEPALLPNTSTYRLIGLDTPTPFMQLSGTIFKGQHRSLLGTELLFTEQKDDNDRTKRYVTPIGTTEQRVRFNEVRLEPKHATPQTSPKGKGKAKERAKGSIDIEAPTVSQDVGRITGATGPVGRTREGKRKGKMRQIDVNQEPEAGTPLDATMDDGQGESADGAGLGQLQDMGIGEDQM